MQQITDNARLNGALHIANTALRFGRQGNNVERDRAINRMYDVLETCQYPYYTTSRLVKRLGRGKSLVLGLRKPLIDLALKMETD